MQRAVRTVFAYFLFVVLFVVGAFFVANSGTLMLTQIRAQPAPAQVEEVPTETEGEEEQPAEDETFAPRGPDELFTPLDDATYEGSLPEKFYKAVILRVPNEDSWELRPDDDLKSNDRYVAGGFVLMLEQKLEYMPQVHLELNRARAHYYAGHLRSGEVPRAGQDFLVGAKFDSLENAARTFGADIVFALSFTPAVDDIPAMGACFRHVAGEGINSYTSWNFTKLGQPEANSVTTTLASKVDEITFGIGATTDEAGNFTEVAMAPVPSLVSSDKALRNFVKMRDALDQGEMTKAYVELATLMKVDPACGRAGLYAMETYRGLAEGATTAPEHEKWMNLSIESGREALKHSPNDVYIRGRLCWNATTHFNRREWAQAGLKQALKVQPACVDLFNWWISAYSYDDKTKQAEWMIDNALDKVRDGRIELTIGNTYYGAGDFKKGVEWYLKGIELAPFEHEMQLSLGLCANYEAERLAKIGSHRAREYFATAAEALWAAIEIDPEREVKWSFEFYVRAKTRKFTYLPSNPAELDRLFLAQAVVNGLTSASNTGQWDRLSQELIEPMRNRIRKQCREAKPGDETYAVNLMARLAISYADDDSDDLIHTLWLMRNEGIRPPLYVALMNRFGPLVEEFELPVTPEDEPDENEDVPPED